MKKLIYLTLLLVLTLGSFSATTAQTPAGPPLDRLWMLGPLPDYIEDLPDSGGGWDGGLDQSGWVVKPDSVQPAYDNIAIAYAGNLWVLGGAGSGGAFQKWDGSAWSVVYDQQYSRSNFDGCLGLDSSGKVVIDMFGHPLDNRWIRYALPPGGYYQSGPSPSGYPSTGLWGHDIVSMLQHTNENVCYISGGSTVAGGGDQNWLYRWWPEFKILEPLGQFTYASPGVAFHFSWYVPWIGEDGAICIGGGVNDNADVYADTQCYDIHADEFLAPNADLGPLPQAWWGGGDAWRVDNTVYQLWGFGGVDVNFDVLQESFYWNGTAFVYGPQPQHAVFRNEGDNLDDSVWAANGATDGGTPEQKWQEWLDWEAPGPTQDMYICNGNVVCGANSATVKVKVCKTGNVPLNGAAVSGVWITPDGQTPSGTPECNPTGSGGCGSGVFKDEISWTLAGTYAYLVLDIEAVGYVYNSSLNYKPVPGWAKVCP